MSRFSGPQRRGALRDLHSVRRTEAEDRQAAFDAIKDRLSADDRRLGRRLREKA